jgi:uncharacterized protein (TIGR03083 family)
MRAQLEFRMAQLGPASLPPILTAHLFPELDARLLELLRSLTDDEWMRATIVPKWNVKQIAAHLLDTALRRLTFGRDASGPRNSKLLTGGELTDLVNRLNAEGVEVYGRLSAPVLIALSEVALSQLHRYLQSLDPFAPAAFPVSWAGESESQNWFDIARELTERWHHQQQIRLSVDQPGIMTPALYSPVLDCFMRGLPHAYRDVEAPAGATVEVAILGECGGTWWLQRQPDRWSLVNRAAATDIVVKTTMPQEIAWRVFTKGIDRFEARRQTTIAGDERLGGAVLGVVAIVG